jgi:CRP-like cAMP-binding protein
MTDGDRGNSDLGSIPAFSPTLDSAGDYLEGLPIPQKVAASVTLLEQGERPQTVGLIRSGIVKLTYTNSDAVEAYLGLRSEGWWINGTLALLDLPSLCALTAVTDCMISSFSADDFSRRLQKDPRLLRQFLSTQCRELLMVQQHSIMRGSSAQERLAYLRGESTNSIWKTVDPTLVMRQNEIAELLSISPEHFSRIKKERHREKPD